jgi:sulfite exporter TauE/SafE
LEVHVTRTQILRLIFGIVLAGGGFGILSEAARDSTAGAFRTIAIVAGAVLLVAGLTLAGPVLKAVYKKKWDK